MLMNLAKIFGGLTIFCFCALLLIPMGFLCYLSWAALWGMIQASL